jgi:hypothetical protein
MVSPEDGAAISDRLRVGACYISHTPRKTRKAPSDTLEKVLPGNTMGYIDPANRGVGNDA